MTWPWASPEATRQGIQQRVKARYPAAEIQLPLYEVAFRRLLVRLDLADPGRWVLKGGVALLLRLDPSRASNDIDIAYRDAERVLEDALAALERAFALDLGDFFAFRLVGETAEVEEDEEGTLPLRVDALIGAADGSPSASIWGLSRRTCGPTRYMRATTSPVCPRSTTCRRSVRSPSRTRSRRRSARCSSCTASLPSTRPGRATSWTSP